MKGVELYGRVRHAVRIEGLSHREAARRFGIDPRTVAKMMVFSVPPGYRRKKPPVRPKLDPFIGIIDRIMEEDKRRPAKQRHTSKRIFERLRDEHGFAGGLTIVKDYVHERVVAGFGSGWFAFRENIMRGYVRLRAESRGIDLGRHHNTAGME